MTTEKSSLKSWSDEEKPREKLLRQGATALSTNELLAVVLRSGMRGETAIDLARRIFADYHNDLNQLAQASPNDLMHNYKGIGLAKAAAIVSAIELSRRRLSTPYSLPSKITDSQDVFKHFMPQLNDLDHEEFWALFLNNANHVLGIERISSGGMNATVTDHRLLFHKAISLKASAFAVAHNHPSGNLAASADDRATTQRLQEAGKILNIKLLDHLIISHNDYYSFADNGFLAI